MLEIPGRTKAPSLSVDSRNNRVGSQDESLWSQIAGAPVDKALCMHSFDPFDVELLSPSRRYLSVRISPGHPQFMLP